MEMLKKWRELDGSWRVCVDDSEGTCTEDAVEAVEAFEDALFLVDAAKEVRLVFNPR